MFDWLIGFGLRVAGIVSEVAFCVLILFFACAPVIAAVVAIFALHWLGLPLPVAVFVFALIVGFVAVFVRKGGKLR